MAPRKGGKAKPTAETLALIEAIAFCSIAQKDVGTPNDTHIILQNSTALTANGVLAVGTHTDFADIQTCPHTLKLLAALKKCRAEYSITQTDANQLVVKSGAFRAIVPCMNAADLFTTWPDNPVAKIDDRIKAGFATLNSLLAENTQHVVTSSLLLQANSMLATDRALIVEYWHGIDLPPGLVIPKIGVTAVAKATKTLNWLGFSDSSVTFWFEDNSWIKCQTHSEPWPKTDTFFNRQYNPQPFPAKLAEAVDAVAPFTEDGMLYFGDKSIASHRDDSVGATHDIPGLTFKGTAPIVGSKRMQSVLSLATHIDFDADENFAYAQGANCRMVISKAR